MKEKKTNIGITRKQQRKLMERKSGILLWNFELPFFERDVDIIVSDKREIDRRRG